MTSQHTTELEKVLQQKYPDIHTNNELQLEFTGINGFSPYLRHNSANRGAMFATQLGHRIPTDYCDRMIATSGLDRQMADSTIRVEMPEDGVILRIMPKYKEGPFDTSLNFNPEVYVFYQSKETNVIDYFVIPYNKTMDQEYGFKYVHNDDNLSMLRKGNNIPKGTVFADSPNVKDKTYCPGVLANVAFCSDPGVAEDGFVVRRGFLNKLTFRSFVNVTVEYGNKNHPLFIHGDKIFPDIGDYLDESGLIMALRDYDDNLQPVCSSINDLKEVDHFFDKLHYAKPGYKGRIIDIEVIKTPNNRVPDVCCAQADKYYNAFLEFNKELLAFEQQLEIDQYRKYGKKMILPLSPRLSTLFVSAINITRQTGPDMGKVKFLYKKEDVDAYRIKFVIEYVITPTYGYKLSDMHGGKGVITDIREDADMPVDADGNVTDIIVDAGSRYARMIPGSLYEHGHAGILRDAVTKHIAKIVNYQKGMTYDKFCATVNDEAIAKAFEVYLTVLYLSSDQQFNDYKVLTYSEQVEVIFAACEYGYIHLYHPINNQVDLSKTLLLLRDYIKPTIGPVTYRDSMTGQMARTETAVQIAPIYLMLLNKTGGELLATSTAMMHHFGMLAPVNKGNKSALPWRNNPPKVMGETEGRLYVAYCGRRMVAELIDRSNNMQTQQGIAFNILSADKPAILEKAVDRKMIAYGANKPLQLFKHIMACRGVNLKWTKEATYTKRG